MKEQFDLITHVQWEQLKLQPDSTDFGLHLFYLIDHYEVWELLYRIIAGAITLK